MGKNRSCAKIGHLNLNLMKKIQYFYFYALFPFLWRFYHFVCTQICNLKNVPVQKKLHLESLDITDIFKYNLQYSAILQDTGSCLLRAVS